MHPSLAALAQETGCQPTPELIRLRKTTLKYRLMNLKDFTAPQQTAVLDLALLAMYADGHLASAEDERIGRLLTEMGFRSDYERNTECDAAVSRVRRHSDTTANARAHASTLAQVFAPEQKQIVVGLLRDLLASDSVVSRPERTFLAVLEETFRL